MQSVDAREFEQPANPPFAVPDAKVRNAAQPDAAVSEQTKATKGTLGKRSADRSSEQAVSHKRQRLLDEASQVSESPEELDDSTSRDLQKISDRAQRMVPNSANGSTNPNPQLDINVTLPQNESDEEDLELRRERR